MAVVFKRRSAGVFSVIPAKARVGGVFKTISGTEPTPSTGLELLGVGSEDNSLTSFPITPATTDGDWYVDPTAGTNGTGTLASPFNNLDSAYAAVSDGQTILVRAGTLAPSTRFNRSTSWTAGINIWAYGTERPVLDCTNLGTGDASRILNLSGAREHYKGFEVINGKANSQAIYLSGSFYHIEDFWVHDCLGDGIYIANFGTGAGNNTIQDSAVYRLGDGTTIDTNVPDGIVCTGNTGSPSVGNRVVRCFVANGPDDGIDFFRARATRMLDSVTYDCGRYWNGNTAGDGNGFKMGGGDNDSGDNFALGCLSINNRAQGATHNEARNTPTESDPNIVFAFMTVVGSGGRGIDAGGDQAAHMNVLRDAIMNGNSTNAPYVGANTIQLRTSHTLSIANPQFTNPAAYDWSLDPSSAAVGAAQRDDFSATRSVQSGASGTVDNLGASTTSLRIAKAWIPVVVSGATRLTPAEIHTNAPEPTPPPTSGSINVRALDVSYWDGVEGSGFATDWDLNFPVSTTSGRQRVVGFRFPVNIPQGATINSATLKAYQNQNSTWASADNRTLGAEQVDNAGVATSLSDLQARYTNVGTSHAWANLGTISNNDPVPTGSIAAVIQQIVNRPGWVAGNHVMLWCYHPGSGGHNAQWRSVVGQSASVQPQLEVAYES